MDRKHDQDQIKADSAAIGSGLCPETGRDLRDLPPEIIRHHVALTFPHYDPSNKGGSDYERRARLVLGYADSREKELTGGKR